MHQPYRFFGSKSVSAPTYRPLLDRPRSATPKVSGSSLNLHPSSLARDLPRTRTAAGYAPVIPERINQAQLEQEVVGFFGLQAADVRAKERTYRSFHDAKRYAQTLGERKTLCLEEAFILYVLVSQTRPHVVVEIGTQQGKSARRLLDMMALLDLQAQLICIDIENQVQFFAPHEAKFVQQDVTGFFSPFVLEAYKPDLVFLDVHGFHLLTEAISACRMHSRPARVVIHDCGPGLCNPHMTITRDDPNVTSFTGTWERYVLAKEFGVADPLSRELDQVVTDRDRLRIFGTPHGLGVLAPKW